MKDCPHGFIKKADALDTGGCILCLKALALLPPAANEGGGE